jgi:hypothetical protein
MKLPFPHETRLELRLRSMAHVAYLYFIYRLSHIKHVQRKPRMSGRSSIAFLFIPVKEVEPGGPDLFKAKFPQSADGNLPTAGVIYPLQRRQKIAGSHYVISMSRFPTPHCASV